MSGTTHCLYLHGHLYIEWAARMNLPIGIFTEGSVEKGNQSEKDINSNHSRHFSVKAKNHDLLFGGMWR